jgi:Zn-dependent peptidase ImmA (M78 family)
MSTDRERMSEADVQQLLDHFMTDARSGNAPKVAKYLERCPEAERERLRPMLEAEVLLSPAPPVSDATVQRTMSRIAALRARRDPVEVLRARLRQIDLPRNAAATLRVLLHEVQTLANEASRQGQPIAAFREASPELFAGIIREAGTAARDAFVGYPSAGATLGMIAPRLSALSKSVAGFLQGNVSEELLARLAEGCLRDAMIDAPPVILERLAEHMNLVVLETKMEGCEGCLAAADGAGVIAVNSEMPDAHRKRYTLAHEIAHFLLHADRKTISDTAHDLADFETADELQANTLAAHLVMPAFLMPGEILGKVPSLADGDRIADLFDVSLLAALRRLVRAAAKPCRLIVTHHGEVTMTDTSPLLAASARSHLLAPSSSAIAGLIGRESGAEGTSDLALADWMPESADRTRVAEQTRMLDKGYAYTVLSHVS